MFAFGIILNYFIRQYNMFPDCNIKEMFFMYNIEECYTRNACLFTISYNVYTNIKYIFFKINLSMPVYASL